MPTTDRFVPRPTLPQPLEYPTIDPIPEGQPRPFWSVMIPTLNRPDFVRRAMESVLAEGYGPDEMQICVVDNYTTVADIEALVQEIGGGRIEYFRQPKLQDITTSWTTCIQLSRGQYVQLLHDDTEVLPGFYAANRALIERGCPLIFSQIIGTDQERNWRSLSARVRTENDIIHNPLDIVTVPNAFLGNTMIAHRDLYEKIGGYYDGIYYGCDQEITVRLIMAAQAVGQVGMLSRPYCLAPMHKGQGSYNYWINPGFTKDDLFTWEMLISHDDTPAFRQAAYNYLSYVILEATQRLRNEGYYWSAFRQSIWAYRLRPNWKTLTNIPKAILAIPGGINRRYLKIGPRTRHYSRLLKRRLLGTPGNTSNG